MDKAEVHEAITNLRFLSGLAKHIPDAVAEALEEAGRVERATPGMTLFQRGQPTTQDGIVLLRGEVSVEKPDSPETHVQAPELMGEMSQFNPNKVRTATVKAVDDIRVLHFQWGDFNKSLASRLNQADCQAVSQAIQDYAWEHFTS